MFWISQPAKSISDVVFLSELEISVFYFVYPFPNIYREGEKSATFRLGFSLGMYRI